MEKVGGAHKMCDKKALGKLKIEKYVAVIRPLLLCSMETVVLKKAD